MYNFYQVVLEW